MEPFPFVLISLMDAWDVMFGCSTQHSMDQLKVHITRKSWVRALYLTSNKTFSKNVKRCRDGSAKIHMN